MNGRAQVPHSRPNSCFDYLFYGSGKGESFRDEENEGRSEDNGRGAHHSDERIVPETYWDLFELEPGDEEELEGRTRFAKNWEFTLLPASLVDVSLGRHYDLES